MFELVNLDFYIHWWWAVRALARLNTSSYSKDNRMGQWGIRFKLQMLCPQDDE